MISLTQIILFPYSCFIKQCSCYWCCESFCLFSHSFHSILYNFFPTRSFSLNIQDKYHNRFVLWRTNDSHIFKRAQNQTIVYGHSGSAHNSHTRILIVVCSTLGKKYEFSVLVLRLEMCLTNPHATRSSIIYVLMSNDKMWWNFFLPSHILVCGAAVCVTLLFIIFAIFCSIGHYFVPIYFICWRAILMVVVVVVVDDGVLVHI